MIAVVDGGGSSLRGLSRALATAAPGEEVIVTADAEVIRRAERVVVAGPGAVGQSVRALAKNAPLGQALLEAIGAGKPYLGIGHGLQILFESSEAAPDAPGLAVLRGEVVRIPDGLFDGSGGLLKVPHVGWNDVRPDRAHPVLRATFNMLGHGRSAAVPFYFAHSYRALPREPFVVAATARYGAIPIVAAVAADNILAVQFHPERSQRAGLALLAAFASWRI